MIVTLWLGTEHDVASISIDISFQPVKGMTFVFTCIHDDCPGHDETELLVHDLRYDLRENMLYVVFRERNPEVKGEEAIVANCIRKHPENLRSYIKGSVS